jgi:hypothetical protein
MESRPYRLLVRVVALKVEKGCSKTVEKSKIHLQEVLVVLY